MIAFLEDTLTNTGNQVCKKRFIYINICIIYEAIYISPTNFISISFAGSSLLWRKDPGPSWSLVTQILRDNIDIDLREE